jgi:VWFA-related protein
MACCAAQNPNARQPGEIDAHTAAQVPPLRATVRLVIAPTTVVAPDGRYVDGLTEKDFLLTDNGKPQPIQVDVTYVPISFVVAVQSNLIAAEALNKVHRIGPMIEPLIIGERGEAAVISYDDQISVFMDFTSNAGRLTAAFKQIPPSGGKARMIDAAEQAIQMLAARPASHRRVLLLVGETRDRGSQAKLEHAVTLAQRENVSVYAVSYSAYLTPSTAKPGTIPTDGAFDLLGVFREIGRLAKTNAAEAFTKYTGSSHLSFLKQRALERAISRIGEELHSQYLLSFTAGAESGDGFHAIEVQVKNRPDLVVRTRPGYWLEGPGEQD